MLLEVRQVCAADITQLHVFEVRPDAFVRVEIRGVARQLLESQAPGCALGQEVFDGLTAMNRCPVPDHQQLSRNMSQQMLEKADDVGAGKRVILHTEQQSSARGDATDDRQVVMGKWETQRRRVATWGKTADHCRQQGKARLVYPNDRATFA